MQPHTFSEIASSVGRRVPEIDRPVVCVQGLGFVGAAMAIAVANAQDLFGVPCFNVIGVDLNTNQGLERIEGINSGVLPFQTADRDLPAALRKAHTVGNLVATSEPTAYSLASTIIVDIPFDVTDGPDGRVLALDDFRTALRVIGEYLNPFCLVIIESTVPPGACEKVVLPELTTALKERGVAEESLLLAHSYERVMPGRNYYNSIVKYWRVYAGTTPEAADACEEFLSKVIDVTNYPLTRLSSTTASETGKVLENSFRAATIALIEEWGRFAEAIHIDLFEVISAIRKRPTHSNIRVPGFGVGGYCLTKDPLLAPLAARAIFALPNIHFPFCELAVATNETMPLASLHKVEKMLGGNIKGKSLLLLGVSYRPDIGDTRFSPSELFVKRARAQGAKVKCFDPYVDYWPELGERLLSVLPTIHGVDAVIFAVAHEEYKELDVEAWLNKSTPVIIDANNVLTESQRKAFLAASCKVASVGRGEGL